MRRVQLEDNRTASKSGKRGGKFVYFTTQFSCPWSLPRCVLRIFTPCLQFGLISVNWFISGQHLFTKIKIVSERHSTDWFHTDSVNHNKKIFPPYGTIHEPPSYDLYCCCCLLFKQKQVKHEAEAMDIPEKLIDSIKEAADAVAPHPVPPPPPPPPPVMFPDGAAVMPPPPPPPQPPDFIGVAPIRLFRTSFSENPQYRGQMSAILLSYLINCPKNIFAFDLNSAQSDHESSLFCFVPSNLPRRLSPRWNVYLARAQRQQSPFPFVELDASLPQLSRLVFWGNLCALGIKSRRGNRIF